MLDPIKHCKICFEPIRDVSFHSIIFKNSDICEGCFKRFYPRFIHFKIGSIKCLSLYEYDENIRDLLFKFKGCYDIVLVDVFFERYLWYLKLRYKGYSIVPIPSYYLEDEKRGFNHVVEIYSRLNLPMLNIVVKTENIKQAKLKKKDREKTKNRFTIQHLELLKNKNVLVVDDVYTTGSSMKAVIELVKKGKPKNIQVLVMAKNILKPKK